MKKLSVVILSLTFYSELLAQGPGDSSFTKLNIFSISELDLISKTSNLRELYLLYSPKSEINIDIKEPELLQTLSIANFSKYSFLDSFPNLRELGIEGRFNGNFRFAFNHERLLRLTIHDIVSNDLTFLEKMYNLQYVDFYFRKTTMHIASSIYNLSNLAILRIESHHGELALDSMLEGLTNLTEVDGDILFNYNNIEILSKCNNLHTITFRNQKISKLPPNLENLSSKPQIFFKNCKFNTDTREKLFGILKNARIR